MMMVNSFSHPCLRLLVGKRFFRIYVLVVKESSSSLFSNGEILPSSSFSNGEILREESGSGSLPSLAAIGIWRLVAKSRLVPAQLQCVWSAWRCDPTAAMRTSQSQMLIRDDCGRMCLFRRKKEDNCADMWYSCSDPIVRWCEQCRGVQPS